MLVSEDKYESSRDYCKEYIDAYCIWRTQNGETLPGKTPGHEYIWQFYLSRALYNVDFMERFVDLFVYHVERNIGHWDFQLTGLQTGSTPMIVGLTMLCRYKYRKEIGMFSVRKERKAYGLQNYIEGFPFKNTPVLIVDDLSNSANTIIKCYRLLQELNADVLPYTFTCVNKANTNDTTRMKSDKYFKHYGIEGMTPLSPFTLDDFDLNIGVDEDYYMFDNAPVA